MAELTTEALEPFTRLSFGVADDLVSEDDDDEAVGDGVRGVMGAGMRRLVVLAPRTDK